MVCHVRWIILTTSLWISFGDEWWEINLTWKTIQTHTKCIFSHALLQGTLIMLNILCKAKINENHVRCVYLTTVLNIGFFWLVTVTDISRPCQSEKLNPLPPWPGFDPSFSGHNDEQSSASGQDYASDRSAIRAGILNMGESQKYARKIHAIQPVMKSLAYSLPTWQQI